MTTENCNIISSRFRPEPLRELSTASSEHFFYSDKLPKAQHLLRLHGIQVQQHTWSGIILSLTLGLTSFRCTSALEDMPVCDVAHVNDLDRCEADVAEVVDEVVRA